MVHLSLYFCINSWKRWRSSGKVVCTYAQKSGRFYDGNNNRISAEIAGRLADAILASTPRSQSSETPDNPDTNTQIPIKFAPQYEQTSPNVEKTSTKLDQTLASRPKLPKVDIVSAYSVNQQEPTQQKLVQDLSKQQNVVKKSPVQPKSAQSKTIQQKTGHQESAQRETSGNTYEGEELLRALKTEGKREVLFTQGQDRRVLSGVCYLLDLG